MNRCGEQNAAVGKDDHVLYPFFLIVFDFSRA